MTDRAFHRQRPLAAGALFWGAGLAAGILWRGMAYAVVWAGLAVSLALTALLWHGKKPVVMGVCFALLFMGILWGHAAMNPALPPEGRYRATGVVEGLVERREQDGRLKAVLRQVTLRGDADKTYAVPRAYFTWYPGEQVGSLPADGQALAFSTSLYHPASQQNPHGFDFRLYLLRQGIPVGLSGAKEMRVSRAGTPGFWLRARQAISGLLDAALGADSALPKALLIGDRDDLPQETRQDFQVTGIAHVLAVSGLHVSILILILSRLLLWMKLGPKGRMAVLALFLLAYARLLDFSAPVVRASILGVLLLLGRLVHRRIDPLTSLALAFMGITLFRPLDLTSIGFQLSFAAVLGIILVGDRLEHLYRRATKGRKVRACWRSLLEALIITLSASLFTFPLIALHFYQLPLVGLVLSPLASALVGWVMLAALPVLAIAPLWMQAAQALAWPAKALSRGLLEITAFTRRLEGGMLRVPAPGVVMLGACFLLLVLFSRYTAFSRRWKAGLMALAVAAPLGAMAWKRPAPVRFTQFSVGSADAAILEDGDTTYVIDAGSHGGDVASYLRARGRQVDTLLITHLHNDHIGGLQQLLEAGIPIAGIALAEGAMEAAVEDNSLEMLRQAQQKGIPIRYLAKGDTLSSGRANMRVLWPEAGKVYPGRSANLHCLTMLWNLDGYTLLTGGDLDGEYEGYAATPAQLLLVAHHGSKHSTSLEYLRAVSPQAALLSVSPSHLERASATLGRLDRMGIPVYMTPAHGALTLTLGPEEPIIQGHVKQEEP